MPSSDPTTVPIVMRLVDRLRPLSIIDVGCGNGRYGFLFREMLDWNWGRLAREEWEASIYGVEIDKEYLTPVHDYVYDKVYVADWNDRSVPLPWVDLVFMGDVLEHFPEGAWQDALGRAIGTGKTVIVVSPNWVGSGIQQAWHGHVHEAHRSELSPAKVGGKCLFANSKCFICGFDNGSGLLEGRDLLL